MIDLAALAAEITGDSLKLGYAQHVTSGADSLIADLLNADTGPGAANIALPSMPRDDFLSAILPALGVLPAKDAVTQGAWDRYLRVICAASSVSVASPSVQALLDGAAAQGLLTAEQRAAIGVRVGSRAEVLFGAGTVVSHTQVAAALGRGGA